ncbi:MAG: hypothetical protein ACLVKO_06660 [Dysgonomonas sp.]
MKKNIIFICLLFILFSCKDKKEKINSFTFDHLKCEMKIYAQNDSTKPFMKLDLYFAYPAKAENDTILSRVQKAFVYAFAGEKYAGMSPKGAFEAYKDSLAMDSQSLASDMQDDLDLFGECYINIKTEVTDTTQNIIAVKTEKKYIRRRTSRFVQCILL